MNNKVTIIIIGIIVLLGLIFYWFQLRPTNIRKKCAEIAADNANIIEKYRGTINEESYKSCLTMNGLKQ